MTTINIGTNKGSITKVKFKKIFKDITYQDILSVVTKHYGSSEKVSVQG